MARNKMEYDKVKVEKGVQKGGREGEEGGRGGKRKAVK